MRTLLTAALAMVLGACATGKAPHPTAVSSDAYCAEYDCAKMSRVSRGARTNGHLVIWVNPPRKSQVAGAAAETPPALN